MARRKTRPCEYPGCDRVAIWKYRERGDFCGLHGKVHWNRTHTIVHGTLNEYQLGCRCDKCVSNRSAYNTSMYRGTCMKCGKPAWPRAKKRPIPQNVLCRSCFREKMAIEYPIPHGTENGYNRGCRCSECTKAQTLARKGRRQRQAAREREKNILRHTHHAIVDRIQRIPNREVEDGLQHGTDSTYSNHGCRCAECKEARRVYQAQYRDEHPERGRASGRLLQPTEKLDPLTVPSFESRGEGRNLIEVVHQLTERSE